MGARWGDRQILYAPFAEMIRKKVVNGDRIRLRILLALHQYMLQPMPWLMRKAVSVNIRINVQPTHLNAQEELAL